MTDLKQLVSELVAVRKRAATDLEAAPYQTRASLTNMVMEAREKLESLKVEYFKRVRTNTAALFLFGEPARVAAFAETAYEEGAFLTIQVDSLYQSIADKIEPSFGATREFGPTQLEGVIKELRDHCRNLGVRDMKMPQLQSLQVIGERLALVAYIRQLVQAAVGNDLLRIYVDRKVNERAEEQLFSGKTLPVALVGLDPDEVGALAPLFTNSMTIEAGTSSDGEVTKEYVLNQLSALRKKVKSKTSSTDTNHTN